MNFSERCECGAAKTRRAISCTGCAYLDGRYPLQSAIITTLRVLGRASVCEICDAVFGSRDHTSRSTAQQAVQKMLGSRLTRRWRESEGGWVPGCWEYELVSKGAA